MENTGCTSFVTLSNQLSSLFLSHAHSVIYILIMFLILTILLRFKFYFPPCCDALNARIHSLFMMLFF